jgi:DNA-binding transcriptional ArsR family regulator
MAQLFAILKLMLKQSADLSLVFQALADPSRRGMVERLSRGPASVSDLAMPLAMTMAAVMQHLKVLEASGLVTSEKVGRVRTCRIEPTTLSTVEDWVASRIATWNRQLDLLGDFLDAQAEPPSDEPPHDTTTENTNSGAGSSTEGSTDTKEKK